MDGSQGLGRGGKQVRRLQRGNWIGFWALLAIALALFALAAVVVVADPPGGGNGALIAMFSAVGVFFMLAAVWVFRRARPKQAEHLSVQLSAAEVRRGQPLEATLTVERPPEEGASLELALVCTEHYDVKKRVYNPNGADYDQRSTDTDELHRDARQIPPGAGAQTLTFAVPADGPFSYKGDCVSAIWHLVAVERRPRRSDLSLDTPVWVLP